MKLTNDQLLKLQKQCLESSPFPIAKPEKGEDKAIVQAAKENQARVELYDSLRENLPALIDELLSARHKLNV